MASIWSNWTARGGVFEPFGNMSMQKIGLTQRVDVIPDHGERRDALDQAWIVLLQRLGYVPVPLPNLVNDVCGYLDALGLDGVVVTGGNDLPEAPEATWVAEERDRFERTLLDTCAETGRPVFGVCRGLQLAVVHHGGQLVAVDGHVAKRHRLIVRASSGVPLRDREVVNSFHRFGVCPEQLDGQWHVLATADDGTVEAIQHREHPLLAVMWHPERSPSDPQDVELIRYVFGRRTS